jgi:hypothetical protein
VSVEFDDLHDRYYYVRRGIEFLKEGERYNVDHPVLLSDLGWFLGHKIGRADERVEYRRLFRLDPDFHPEDRPLDQRDNWLVSKEWYLKAVDAVDLRGKPLGRKNARDLYSDPAKSQINYAEAIEEEGYFEKAQRAWVRGGEEWREFGQRVLMHTSGVPLRLGEEPRLADQVVLLRGELDLMGEGIREDLLEEKLQALSEDERKLHDAPRDQVSPEQAGNWYSLQSKVAVSDREVAERIARDHPDKGAAAWKLARQILETESKLRLTQSYKEIMNYDYWQLRCDFEQDAVVVAARELMLRANKAATGGDVIEAKKLYNDGFAQWRKAFDKYPAILDDTPVMGEHLLGYARSYRDVLDQLGEPLYENFHLWDVIEKFDQEKEFQEEVERWRQSKSSDGQ